MNKMIIGMSSVKYFINAFIRECLLLRILKDKKFEYRRLEGEIIRNTHSIEKGLSLESVRLGFGYLKIKEAYELIERYIKLTGNVDAIPLLMFTDALSSYLEFHKRRDYSDDHIDEIKAIYSNLVSKQSPHNDVYGGYKSIGKKNFNDSEQVVISRLFKDRHSVREFLNTPVDETDLFRAIELATHCPSACNRQCYRVYIVDKGKFDKLEGWMDGVGGFANCLDKILIVTGNLSVYRPGERYQFAITGSVFASYLTLSLEAYNIGCCFMQRPIEPNKKWEKILKVFEIPKDEQVVCALGIGNFKDTYKVPVSYRLPVEIIAKNV